METQSKNTGRGLILLCDLNGYVKDIISLDLPVRKEYLLGSPLIDLVKITGISKINDFFNTIKTNGYAFDWEFSICIGQEDIQLLFTGLNIVNNILIIATTAYTGVNGLLEEMTRIVNEQTNSIRSLVKENKQNLTSASKTEELYDELSLLNNELANNQRMLAKKNFELERLNLKLEEINRIDVLTGLFNRKFFYEKIKEEIAKSKRIGYSLVLAYIDINSFKRVNDEQGHVAGDILLQEFAGILKNFLREDNDFIFRFGGDEFIIILTNCSEADAEDAMKRTNMAIALIDETISISYGLIELPVKTKKNILENIDKYIKSADRKMYQFKKKLKKSAAADPG